VFPFFDSRCIYCAATKDGDEPRGTIGRGTRSQAVARIADRTAKIVGVT